jgi:hypothetical protein
LSGTGPGTARAAGGRPAGVQRLISALEGLEPEADPQAAVAVVRPALTTAIQDMSTRALYHGHDKSFTVWSRIGGPTLHASVHHPGHVTAPHDHGPAWAVYGVVFGLTTFSRIPRGPDAVDGVARLGPAIELELPPGATEVVWPGQVHAVANRGDGISWNLVVRSRLLSEISRAVYDLRTGAYRIQSPRQERV